MLVHHCELSCARYAALQAILYCLRAAGKYAHFLTRTVRNITSIVHIV